MIQQCMAVACYVLIQMHLFLEFFNYQVDFNIPFLLSIDITIVVYSPQLIKHFARKKLKICLNGFMPSTNF